MSFPTSSGPAAIIADAYAAALADYVSGAGEVALAKAYELGRRASAEGVGVLEMAMMHHQALQGVLATQSASAAPVVSLAGQFLAESLSPFEMTLRAYQANARLLGLSETLASENAEINRARTQLRTILDATTAVIYLKDAEGRYVFVNQQFEVVFGLRRDDVVGHLDTELALPAPMTLLGRDDALVFHSREAREAEETIQTDDGSRTYLSLKVPLLDPTGVAYAVCCVATDITERKRAAEALRRAKEETEAANRELEAFSYSVAHDLRAPLRSIDGFSQVLLEDYTERLDETGQRYLRFVRESAQHMGHLINDLLTLSRVTRADLRHERVNLTSVARDILEHLHGHDRTRQVECHVQEGLVTMGDPALLRAALENLLGNAWKFTSKRAHGRIDFASQPGSFPPVYLVRDNGAGFNMAYAHKLFGVFQRLHTNDEFAGTGIGLATVRRIVSRHGGRIWAEGAVDQGATFFFTLQPEPT